MRFLIDWPWPRWTEVFLGMNETSEEPETASKTLRISGWQKELQRPQFQLPTAKGRFFQNRRQDNKNVDGYSRKTPSRLALEPVAKIKYNAPNEIKRPIPFKYPFVMFFTMEM